MEKDNGQTRWHYRYDGEHRLTEVISQPRDRNKPQTQVSFRYDPLGRRISKTRQQTLGGRPVGKQVTTRFLWEGFRLLQEIHDDVPLTYVYSDADSYEPLARIDGTEDPDIFWFHCQPNGTPERMTDREGHIRWEGQNSAWGKLLHESIPQETGYAQNLRMQGQYLDRETGLHYNLFRYYDPDSARFTRQDPIGLAGGINLYAYAPNPLKYIDPLGLCKTSGNNGSDNYVDLASPQRRRHILDGDATGGGHRPGTGHPGKSEFPTGWSDDKIMHEISDIATDPSLTSTTGRGGRTVTNGTRDGIDIRVVQEKNGDIVSGFPTNVPRNPR